MDFATETLLYLLISRLAIVTAGVISMVIGYRLFCRGIGVAGGQGGAGGESTVESSLAGVKLSLKNAAPGTGFALFGAVLICIMLIQSSPSVVWDSARKWQAAAGTGQPAETTQTDKLQMRGDSRGAGSIVWLTNLGRELETRGKVVEAERAYRDAVTAMAEPMNDLAWIYLTSEKAPSGKAQDALRLASLAVQLRPDEPRFADTLAKARRAAK